MELKATKINEGFINEAKELGFKSANQYLAFLRDFYYEKQNQDEESIATVFNRTIAFLELERMALRKASDAMALLLEKTEVELQLSDQEHQFLTFLMEKNLKDGSWRPRK